MIALRGIVVALGGMLFVFAPGSIVGLLTRRVAKYNRAFLLWGMGVFIVTLLLASFLASFFGAVIRLSLPDALVTPYLTALAGAIFGGLCLEGGKYLLLRWRKATSLSDGIILGVGAGLLVEIFQGLAWIGAGMRLILGDTSTQELAHIAGRPWPDLIANLLARIVYRITIVTLSAALGLLVARALTMKRLGWLWLAVAINAAFAWGYAVLGLWLGVEEVLPSIVVLAYEGIVGVLAFRWLVVNLQGAGRHGGTNHRKRR